MMNRGICFVLVWLLTLCSVTSFAQSSQNIDRFGLRNLDGQYGFGLISINRFARADINIGFNETIVGLYGGGISALRYSSKRMFWTVSLGYMLGQLNQQRVPDIRFEIDPTTGQYTQVRYGTRTEKWKFRYVTLPVSAHYLILSSKSINLYATGGISLDWIHRLNREITATHDGRFDYVSAGTFRDVSATLRGGIGLYQPIGKRFAAMAESTLGYRLLSDIEDNLSYTETNTIIAVDIRAYYLLP